MHQYTLIILLRRSIFFLVTCLVLLAGGITASRAQNRINADSAARARQQALEVTRAAQKRSLDSARVSRQHSMDSMKAARKIITDGLQAMRKYRESRHYKDSVTAVREDRVAAIREAQRARIDSMKDSRTRVSDSIIAARLASTEVLRAGQKHRADSLAAIKAYKTSKRAADSVAIVRRARTDSVQAARKSYSDSLIAARKVNMDRLKAARKATTDSLTAVRKQRTDSLANIRKGKATETAKQQENKVRDKKIKEKQTEQKQAFALELKIKKKRSVYSNENMLKKKWGVPRKVVQNTFTRFNYYFNANRKMEEAEENMRRTARDKWDTRIPLFNFDPARDSTVFSADMDSVIQKASLGIQIHDPRTKWGDDLYLLLGKAYYYKGDPDNAEASFRYIVALQEKAKADAAKKGAYSNKTVRNGKKESPSIVTPEEHKLLDFMKHQPATNAALLWVSRTYTEYGRLEQAESVLDLLANDPKLPESLKGEVALERAYLAIKQHNDKEATAQLAIVASDKSIPVYTRRRAAFLDGQILQDMGDYTNAAVQYAKVSDMNPKIDMDFYARRNRAYALMLSGGVQKEAIASLKSMLSDGKFSPYYEQIYYVLGRLSANGGDNAGAVAYLQKGITAPKTTKKQKAVSYAALGNIYFNTGEYSSAKTAFDSAGRYASYSPDDSGVALAVRRALVVDKIATPNNVIRQQDSLLALGKLSEKDQRAVVRRYLRKLQAQQADSAFRAENAGINAAAVNDNSGGTDASALTWYFANPVMMQQGVTEFKRKWGNRPLADNWRRSAALAAAGNKISGPTGSDPVTGTDNPANSTLDANGLPTEEALMAYIPTTAENRAAAVDRLQRAYIEMSTAYLRQFEDYTRASATLDSMDKRWASSPYSAEAAYTRYLIALRRNNLKEAQSWSTKLQTDYAGTKWAELVAPAPGDSESGAITASVGSYYDATYDLLQQRQYGEVLSRSRNGRRQYQDETYGNRFRIMEAMAYAGSSQYRQADTILSEFIKTHSGDPLQPWAQEVLNYVTERKKLDNVSAAPGTATSGLPASIAASAAAPPAALPNAPSGISRPSADTSSLPIPSDYAYRPQEPHYFVFVANKMEPKAMGVKAGITDMNTFKFASAGLESSIEPMQGGKAIIVVKPFKNSASAKIYLAQFRDAKMLLREYQANEYQTFVISASNYRKLIKDQGIGSYLVFYRAHY